MKKVNLILLVLATSLLVLSCKKEKSTDEAKENQVQIGEDTYDLNKGLYYLYQDTSTGLYELDLYVYGGQIVYNSATGNMSGEGPLLYIYLDNLNSYDFTGNYSYIGGLRSSVNDEIMFFPAFDFRPTPARVSFPHKNIIDYTLEINKSGSNYIIELT
ncbi:MAG TPA: hypothetical protein ENK64_01665, partial [Flavobacteriales bacterium]|nr:hypothetical protein [Flavobacteriales bacterium]